MRRIGRAAALMIALAVAVVGAIGGAEARAGGLSVGVRLQQEMGTALVPTTRNFRLCFSSDAAGTPTLVLCPAGPERVPAAEAAPAVPPAGASGPTGLRSPPRRTPP